MINIHRLLQEKNIFVTNTGETGDIILVTNITPGSLEIRQGNFYKRILYFTNKGIYFLLFVLLYEEPECLMRYVYITLINKCKMLRIIIIRDTKLLISRFVWKWLKIYMVKCIFDIMTIFETAKLNHHYLNTILDHR